MMKRLLIIQEYSDKLIDEKTTELNGKITDLEEKLEAKPGDENLKKELSELKAEKAKFPDLIQEKIKEKEDELIKVKSDYERDKKMWNLLKSIPTKLKVDLDPDYKNFKISQALEKAMKDFDVIEINSDGKILLKNSKNYEQKSADEFFKTELDLIIDKGTQQTGGGAGNQPPGGNGGKNGELKLNDDMSPNEKVTKIREHIASKGIASYDPKYTEEINKLFKENNLEEFMTIKENK